MYSVFDYGRMAGDTVRMDAYCRAIAAKVRPGSVVLDLGAGTGIASLLAVRAGAKRVHAVDPNPAVWLLPELAAASGVADRIRVHHASSLEIDVPEPVDVVISDLRGQTPLTPGHLASIRDVRARWLAPGGVIIPRVDRLQLAIVEAEALTRRLEDASASFDRLGFPASAARRSIVNQPYSDSSAPLEASDVLSTVEAWATIEYASVGTESMEGTVMLAIHRGGTARGIASFFETELVDGVGFTTAPGHALVYGRLYFPLEEPVVVAPGDRARITFRAGAGGDRWAWDTTFEDARGATTASFRQATFLGAPMSLSSLQRGSENFMPKLSRRGGELREVLVAMDGTHTVKEIAEQLVASHPELRRGGDALERARTAAMTYGI